MKTAAVVLIIIGTLISSNVSKNVNITEDIKKTNVKTENDIELVNIDGQSLKTENLRGKKYLVVFWASWCRPCNNEIVNFDKLIEEGYEIVPINMSTWEKEDFDLDKFLKDKKFKFRPYLDKDGKLKEKFNVDGVPRNIIFDENGNMIESIKGTIDEEKIKEIFKKDIE